MRFLRHIDPDGLRGWGRVAFDATHALTHVVEGMHHEIARGAPILGPPHNEPTDGLTGFVYRSIRTTNRVLALAFEAACGRFYEHQGRETHREHLILETL